MFDAYLNEWRASFFSGEAIDEIIGGIGQNYRKNRFIALWLLKSKEEFWTYYEKRKELGLEHVFNTIIATMFHETEKKEYKQRCINLLGLSHDLQDAEVSLYDIKVLQKDMNSYEVYRKKKLGIPLFEVKEPSGGD